MRRTAEHILNKQEHRLQWLRMLLFGRFVSRAFTHKIVLHTRNGKKTFNISPVVK